MTLHPFAEFVSKYTKHTAEEVQAWLDNEVKSHQFSRWYGWFSKGLTQNILAEASKPNTPTNEPTTQQTQQGINPPIDNPNPFLTPAPAPAPAPEPMRVITNIQPKDNTHDNDWFPYSGIMTVTTSDPAHTQYIDAELRDASNNLVEVDQIDPEFDEKNQIMHLKIQTAFEVLKNQVLSLKVAWADASGEEYSQTTNFKCY